jgi:polynucleotide 5'-kinase involved in rRNA processing
MKEIQNLLCVFSDYERQQHQRPYFLKDNALHLRSGPKLLSEFDKIIQLDKVYQTASQMLEKVTEMVDSTYTASTVVLVGGDENHKLQLIRLIVERGLNKGYDVLFVDRAGKFTEYGTADDDDDLRQAQ